MYSRAYGTALCIKIMRSSVYMSMLYILSILLYCVFYVICFYKHFLAYVTHCYMDKCYMSPSAYIRASLYHVFMRYSLLRTYEYCHENH